MTSERRERGREKVRGVRSKRTISPSYGERAFNGVIHFANCEEHTTFRVNCSPPPTKIKKHYFV